MNKLLFSVAEKFITNGKSIPKNPSDEELVLACFLCKQLEDLCKTAIALLRILRGKNIDMNELPSVDQVRMCYDFVTQYYPNNLFVEGEEDLIIKWNEIQKFSKNKLYVAHCLYYKLQNNISNHHLGNDMVDAIKRRDRRFFTKHFDDLFSGVPDLIKNALSEYKNFIKTDHLSKKQREYIWDYFDALLDLFLNKKEYLKNFTKKKQNGI